MSLRDLILGRKRRIREGLEADAATGVGLSRAVIDAEALPYPSLVAEQATSAAKAGQVSGKEEVTSRKVVLRRTRAMTVPGDLVLTARRQAVLDRLFIVLDPNEVLISAGNRLARLVVANQRLMVAQFSRDASPELTFDFRPGLRSGDMALDAIRALADFCAEPVSLRIVEQPVAGVFAGFSGLPITAISFDEAEFQEALDLILSHPDHDHAGFVPPAEEDGIADAEEQGLDAGSEAAAEGRVVQTEGAPRLEPLVLSSSAAVSAEPTKVSGKLAAMAFLTGCRAVAEDVRLHSRAEAGELSGLRATDSRGPLPAAEGLETWRQAVAPVFGGRLVAVLIPADRSEPMVALAMDERDSVLFSFGKQSLGNVSSQALAAVTGG